MTLRQDSGSAKRLKNKSFEVQDFTSNYDSPLEDFKEKSHGKQYSSPRAMKSDSQTKVEVMDKEKCEYIVPIYSVCTCRNIKLI
jgi:hypothetical protein